MTTRLKLLNFARWLKEYLISWGLLSLIYSITVTVILEAVLENAFKSELDFGPIWIATAVLLLVPGVLEALPLPAVPWIRRGFFSESFWRRLGGPLVPLYLRHELRRGTTWLVLWISVALGTMLPPGKAAFFVFFAQLPVQRALYSIHRWRSIALVFRPMECGQALLSAVWIAQLIQWGIAWMAFGIASEIPADQWLKLGAASLGAVLVGASMALEGDSGKPWMVNFISLAGGTLGGFLCLYSPWLLLAALYIAFNMRTIVLKRFLSVEHLDEDLVIS